MPALWGWSAHSYSAVTDPVAARSKRESEIQRALAASETWIGVAPSAQVVRWIEHFVDDALSAPRVTVRWLALYTRAAHLVLPFKGLAFLYPDVIVIPPIHDEDTLLTAWHELGHARTKDVSGKDVSGRLAREEAAWRYAREHAPVWSTSMQTAMTASVRSHLANTTLKDVVEVHSLEQLISDHEYRVERQRRVRLELQRERDESLGRAKR
jgi:hypothetical protein